MKAKVGRYYFGRHYRFWGVWQWDVVTDTFSSASHITDVATYEDAVKEVYRLNGWGEPKNTQRIY